MNSVWAAVAEAILAKPCLVQARNLTVGTVARRPSTFGMDHPWRTVVDMLIPCAERVMIVWSDGSDEWVTARGMWDVQG